MKDKPRLDEIMTKLLETKIAKFKDESLNLVTCVSIYQEIFDSFVDVMQNANIEISNESANLVAQHYYDSVTVNQTHGLNPNIFTKRATVKGIETKELALLATLFEGSDLVIPLVREIKHRS